MENLKASTLFFVISLTCKSFPSFQVFKAWLKFKRAGERKPCTFRGTFYKLTDVVIYLIVISLFECVGVAASDRQTIAV